MEPELTLMVTSYHIYTIIGEVQNYGTSTIEFVKVVVTFYDASNTVIGTDFTYTEIDELSPNQKSPFEASSYPRKTTDMSIDHCTLQVRAKLT
jgi:hypothetical protein